MLFSFQTPPGRLLQTARSHRSGRTLNLVTLGEVQASAGHGWTVGQTSVQMCSRIMEISIRAGGSNEFARSA